jgi:hypothetical protein
VQGIAQQKTPAKAGVSLALQIVRHSHESAFTDNCEL